MKNGLKVIWINDTLRCQLLFDSSRGLLSTTKRLADMEDKIPANDSQYQSLGPKNWSIQQLSYHEDRAQGRAGQGGSEPESANSSHSVTSGMTPAA